MKRLFVPFALFLAVTVVLSACSQKKITMEHIHGLGYTSDGKQIVMPAHTGLVAYSGGKWGTVDAPKHDYMGFVTVDNGFYSSGHPEAGSKLKNPIGIVKSTDIGRTLTTLGLDGESDFHAMTVGYKSHAIYVFNAQQNSKMNMPGLYYSKDDAKTWQKSEMNGFSGDPLALAAHSMDDKIVAIGTKDGLYVSSDNGNHFNKMLSQTVSSLAFGPEGDLFVAVTNASTLLQINLSSKNQKEIKLPAIDHGDVVLYIAQSPAQTSEIVIATFKKDVFLSKDTGATWSKIVDKGNGDSK